MTQTSLATSADYAEALLTARRAKSILTLLLFLSLLIELSLFFCLRYYKPLPAPTTPANQHMRDVIQYGLGLLDFSAIILPALLAAVIYLILKVQLVGRLLGVGRLTSAFLWSVLLVLLMFPWQAVLNNPAINNDAVQDSIGMKIPGVLFTWAEISHPTLGATFGMDQKATNPVEIGLHWARYVGFPVLSLLILLAIHLKTQHGLRQSLGDEPPVTDLHPTP